MQDEYGRILLQRRTDFDFWGLPGGVLELNEDIQQCARRELLEETGLTVGELSLVGIYTHPDYDVCYPNGDQVQQFTVCFVGTVNGGVLQADGRETTAHCFWPLAETAVLDIPPWYRAMLQDWESGRIPAFSPPFTNGHVVDQIQNVRPFIGTSSLIAVGAFVAATREDGRLLMIQRSDTKTWAMPAGFCDLGENVAHAAVRELFEETGYRIQIDRLMGVYSDPHFHHTYDNGDQVKNVGATFRATIIGGSHQPDQIETLAVDWVAPEDIMSKVDAFLHPLAQQIVRCLDDGTFVI